VIERGLRIHKYYGPHPDDRRMKVVLLHGYGHAWPGSTGLQAERLLSPDTTTGEAVDATDLAWEFFRDRTLPAAQALRDESRIRR
jgi:poly(3-hydroxybutyrate) depolymerase